MKQYITAAGLLAILFLLTGCSYSCEARKPADQAKQHTNAGELRKLSPDLSMAYRKDDHNKKISVLVRTTSPLTTEQRKELDSLNMTIGTVSGSIFTAGMMLKDVPLLAEKPYVQSIELSKKLNLLKEK
jgi:hypothetical protein